MFTKKVPVFKPGLSSYVLTITQLVVPALIAKIKEVKIICVKVFHVLVLIFQR